jgi:hypothetical protein
VMTPMTLDNRSVWPKLATGKLRTGAAFRSSDFVNLS